MMGSPGEGTMSVVPFVRVSAVSSSPRVVCAAGGERGGSGAGGTRTCPPRGVKCPGWVRSDACLSDLGGCSSIWKFLGSFSETTKQTVFHSVFTVSGTS